MSPVPNCWEIASVICKFLVYLGTASSLGGGVSLLLYGGGKRQMVSSILIYQLVGSLSGFHATLAYFLIRVGQINDSGLTGIFDWTMAQILLDTPVGDLSLYRVVGFALLIAASVLLLRQAAQYSAAPGLSFYRRILLLNGFGFTWLLLSFRYDGHISVLSLPVQFLLVIHLTGFAIWIGSLFPLAVLSRTDDKERLQLVLRKFSDHAAFFVGTLLIAGVLLVLNLIHAPSELVTTAYGNALSVKLALVLALLGIAAINKLRLVPALMEQEGVLAFRKSLRIEITVASLLLVVTAYLSTAVGPMGHM